MSRRNARWLVSELPGLVSHGIVTEEAAERLRGHYGERGTGSRRAVPIICAVLGAVLVGAGIILLLAHNWEELSRFWRTVMAFAPVVVGQGLVGWTLLRRTTSTAWSESSATFLAFAVGACIAVIDQTYHVAHRPETLLLTWSLLVVALPYLLRSSLVAGLYLAGITFWAWQAQENGGNAVWFWPLAVLLIPHVRAAVQTNRNGLRAVYLLWASSSCLTVALGITLEKCMPGLWTVAYSGMFCVMALAGMRWFDGAAATWWRRPLQAVGTTGTVVIALILTYSWPWNGVGWSYYRNARQFVGWASVVDYVLAVGLPLVALALLAKRALRHHRVAVVLAATPTLVACAYLSCATIGQAQVAQLLMNCVLFGLGVMTLRQGFCEQSLGVVNGGLAVLSLLVVARFFDSDIGFVTRGSCFIGVGIGFLITNLWLAARRRPAKAGEVA